MANIFSGVRDYNPLMDVLGKINFRLSRKLRAYAWSDHVHPVPTVLLHQCWQNLHDGDAHQQAIVYLIYLGFFFLCLPGKYCKGVKNTGSAPFPMVDVQFLSTPVAFKHPMHPYPSSYVPPSCHSPSTTIIMCSVRIPSSMDAPATNMTSPCAASSPGWYTSAYKAPPPTSPYVLSMWYNDGATSPVRISHRPSAPPDPSWGIT